MNWEFKYAQSVFKQLQEIPKKDLPKIKAAIEDLACKANPLDGAEKLSDTTSVWRIRVGHYRIIFRLEKKQKVILILRVSHRKEAYRNL